MGSGSGESIVASGHRNGSDRLFSRPKNSIMNIQMKPRPVFDVIHGYMQIIEENMISMTFRANARIFSTNYFFGQLFPDGGSTLLLHRSYAHLLKKTDLRRS